MSAGGMLDQKEVYSRQAGVEGWNDVRTQRLGGVLEIDIMQMH